MAKQPEEQNIRSRARRRLIGAVALALAVVVILPMVLDSEPKVTGQDIDLRIPAPDKVGEFVPGIASSAVEEASVEPASAPLDASAASGKIERSAPESATAATMPSESAHMAAQPVETVKPVETRAAEVKKPEAKPVEAKKPEAKPVEAKKPETKPVEVKKAEAKPVEAKKPAADDKSSYIVQVGAFSSAGTASQEADKLKGWGFKAYTEQVGGTTRVRVGPYQDRNKADQVRQLLEKHGEHPVITAVK